MALDRGLLPPAPARAIDDAGVPRFGSYQGSLDSVGLGHLAGEWHRGPLYRLRHRKTWRWCMLATPDVMVAFALLDARYAANAFVFAVDLAGRRPLIDRTALGLPRLSVHVGDRPNEGSDGRFRAQGMQLDISRAVGHGEYHVRAAARDIAVDATLDADLAPPGLVLVAPVPGGTVNVTQKTSGLAAHGTVRIYDHTYRVDGGYGGFDYTDGLLARHTAWRWAFASGRDARGHAFGLNLVQGFNEAGATSENVAWVDGTVLPIGRARFGFEANDPLAPWTVTSDDGAVDLEFAPIGAHREDRNLLIAKSHFVQVAGTFAGTVRTPSGPVSISGVAGVTEDQDVLW